MADSVIHADFIDCGARIGIVVVRNGEKRSLRVSNPFAPEIDAEWRAKHPAVGTEDRPKVPHGS